MTADTTPTPFAAKLRALSKDASPGPWFPWLVTVDTGKGTGPTIQMPSGWLFGPAPKGTMSDAALITTLRNHADRLADLVERVAQYRDARRTLARQDGAEPIRAWAGESVSTYAAMLAALDALVADAPGAASGTESPPSGDGGGA